MTKQKKTVLITALAVIILVIIAVAIYFLFIRKSPEDQLESQGQPDLTSETEEVETEPQIIQAEQEQEQATPEETEFGQVKNLTISFAERFGSYSNQADFQNLIELKALMTSGMKAKTDNLISQSRENNPISENYYAQTAKALSTKEIAYDANFGRAEFLVKCQRQETIGSPDNIRTYYQDIKITLLKVDENWYVDSANWQ